MKIPLIVNEDGLWSMPDHPMRAWGDDQEWMNGRLLAHDVVEHVNGYRNIGTVEDELQALGASWYTRGRWGDDITDGGIISDITNNLSYITHRILEDSGVRPDTYEVDEFQYITTEAKYQMFNHYEHIEGKYRKNTKKSLKKVLGWLVMGQRKAHKKYGRYGRFQANNLFNHIREAIDETTGYPYYQYELHYCIKTAEAKVVEFEWNDY